MFDYGGPFEPVSGYPPSPPSASDTGVGTSSDARPDTAAPPDDRDLAGQFGPDLAGRLADLDPLVCDDAALIDAAAAFERLAAWVAAGQLAVLVELARRRPPENTETLTRSGAHGPKNMSEFAADEVAPALRLSRNAAAARVDAAVELSGRLPATFVALGHGEIDMAKARAVVDSTRALPQAAAGAVEQRVLTRAGRQTVGQLRSSLTRAVIAADPAGAQRRHRQARRERRVGLTQLPDGMAELWARLPADGAVAVYNHIDACARKAKNPGDARSADERRADALVDLITAPAQLPAPLPR